MADKQPRVVDNPNVAEVYANKLISASYDGGGVVVTLGTTRYIPQLSDDAGKEAQQHFVHVTARLALSPSAVMEVINGLNNLLAQLTKAGAAARASQDRTGGPPSGSVM